MKYRCIPLKKIERVWLKRSTSLRKKTYTVVTWLRRPTKLETLKINAYWIYTGNFPSGKCATTIQIRRGTSEIVVHVKKVVNDRFICELNFIMLPISEWCRWNALKLVTSIVTALRPGSSQKLTNRGNIKSNLDVHTKIIKCYLYTPALCNETTRVEYFNAFL